MSDSSPKSYATTFDASTGRLRERDRIVVWSDPIDRRRLAKIGEAREGLSDTFKPTGLWYAFGWEWVEWCRAENFAVERIKHAYRILLDGRRVLSLRSQDEVRKFAERYRALSSPSFIEWSKLREDYAAVEIPSYFWDLRFSMTWYYAWDVASGCVWDPSVILDWEKIEIPSGAP
jgi:hypothetical protein